MQRVHLLLRIEKRKCAKREDYAAERPNGRVKLAAGRVEFALALLAEIALIFSHRVDDGVEPVHQRLSAPGLDELHGLVDPERAHIGDRLIDDLDPCAKQRPHFRDSLELLGIVSYALGKAIDDDGQFAHRFGAGVEIAFVLSDDKTALTALGGLQQSIKLIKIALHMNSVAQPCASCAALEFSAHGHIAGKRKHCES